MSGVNFSIVGRRLTEKARSTSLRGVEGCVNVKISTNEHGNHNFSSREFSAEERKDGSCVEDNSRRSTLDRNNARHTCTTFLLCQRRFRIEGALCLTDHTHFALMRTKTFVQRLKESTQKCHWPLFGIIEERWDNRHGH